MAGIRFSILPTAFLGMIGIVDLSRAQDEPNLHASNIGFVQKMEPLRIYDGGDCKWQRSFRAADGVIFLPGRKKTMDGGRTITEQNGLSLAEITASPERAVFCRPGLFFALDGPLLLQSSGVYRERAWRSSDDLKTVQQETVIFHVPDGPKRDRKGDEWYGLYVYRAILQMPDGAWLATLEGNLESDTIQPPDRQGKAETVFQGRTIVVSSIDEGRTWKYVSTVAYARAGDPVGEGFGEPAIVQLADGRLLCVMRTGHHYPLYSSWSPDQGRTWTPPQYTGLERGCDPCLIRLRDGRILLSYGKRFPEGWSQIGPEPDGARWKYPGEGLLKLAISEDGTGRTWQEATIGRGMGSCYSSIYEVEPDVVFCQVDGWCLRVHLRPRQR